MFNINVRKLGVHFRGFGVYVRKFGVHFRELGVYVGKFGVHFGELGVYVGKFCVHFGELGVYVRKFCKDFGKLCKAKKRYLFKEICILIQNNQFFILFGSCTLRRFHFHSVYIHTSANFISKIISAIPVNRVGTETIHVYKLVNAFY